MTIYTETLPNGFSFQMRFIPGGAFDMGGADAEKDVNDEEHPQRIGVQVAPFYLAPYVMTQPLWNVAMGEDNNPSLDRWRPTPGRKCLWEDVWAIITALNNVTTSNRESLKTGTCRLPTEAEWGYAARGGQHIGGLPVSWQRQAERSSLV